MRLLDLFCGAGGAAMGYHAAGFDEIVGVDHVPQRNYPFEFVLADANEFPLDGFDAIHASPPCQDHMRGGSHYEHGTAWMLEHTRSRLLAQPAPWVIENVPGATMRPDLVVCGCQVGLKLRRVRWFETSWQAFDMASPHHHEGPVVSVVGHGTPSWVRDNFIRAYGRRPDIGDVREAMGIDWMNRDELSQAIPPAYTEYVGGHLLAELRAVAA